MADAANPAVLKLPTTNPALHGPYEDAIIAAFTLATIVIQSIPPAEQKAIWTQVIQVQDRLMTFAEKLDVLHLFSKAGSQA